MRFFKPLQKEYKNSWVSFEQMYNFKLWVLHLKKVHWEVLLVFLCVTLEYVTLECYIWDYTYWSTTFRKSTLRNFFIFTLERYVWEKYTKEFFFECYVVTFGKSILRSFLVCYIKVSRYWSDTLECLVFVRNVGFVLQLGKIQNFYSSNYPNL